MKKLLLSVFLNHSNRGFSFDVFLLWNTVTVSIQSCNFNIINYLLLLRKMSSPRISNFYVPNLSKRFLMAPRPKLDSDDFSLRNGQDEAMRDCTVPVGIIDCCCLNDKYSELT